MIDLSELKSLLTNDLQKKYIPSSVILDKLSIINEEDRKSSVYVDSNYIPFYYYLGKYLKPKKVLELGVNLGYISCAFLTSSTDVTDYLAYQELTNEFYPNKIVVKNIKKIFKNNLGLFVGKFSDSNFQNLLDCGWDLIIFNEEKFYDKYLYQLDFLWEKMNKNGFLIMEKVLSNTPAKDAFNSFCLSKNIENLIFSTRYGTGIIKKE